MAQILPPHAADVEALLARARELRAAFANVETAVSPPSSYAAARRRALLARAEVAGEDDDEVDVLARLIQPLSFDGGDGGDGPAGHGASPAAVFMGARGNESSTPFGHSPARARVFWTSGEVDALREAITKHKGARELWATIKADEAFAQSLGRRSNGDLRKKAESLWTSDEERMLLDAIATHHAASDPWARIKGDRAYERLHWRTNTDLRNKTKALEQAASKARIAAARLEATRTRLHAHLAAADCRTEGTTSAAARSPARQGRASPPRAASPTRAASSPSPGLHASEARAVRAPFTPASVGAQSVGEGRAKRLVWSAEEIGALVGGIRRHGDGKWVRIKDDPDFADALKDRTNVQLKDKARVLTSASRAGRGVSPSSPARDVAPARAEPGSRTAPSSARAAARSSSSPCACALDNMERKDDASAGSVAHHGQSTAQLEDRFHDMCAGGELTCGPRAVERAKTPPAVELGGGARGARATRMATDAGARARAGTEAVVADGGLGGENSMARAAGEAHDGCARVNSVGVDLLRLPRQRRYLGYIAELVAESLGRAMKPAAVRAWLQRHPDRSPVEPSELGRYDIDHVIPRKLGGHDHPWNYFLLEKAANVRCKHYFDGTKEALVGLHVWRLVAKFAAFCREERGIDYSAFSAIE
ncbi:hypothetical protein KFE25_002020 [Diacronema lutheri]|uniref:Myb-like domain-containing protein n=1 Tax=Diacronema lutheri TaxID=2081491 RepID=A0A8J5XTI1_DIALT|nr:hypothetical protein KFE25_002020 [Diacronema lutheri]